VVLPDGEVAATALADQGQVIEFVKDQYRHCKPILALGHASAVLAEAGIDTQLPDGSADPGLFLMPPADAKGQATPADNGSLQAFIAGVAKHRHFARETDPPRV
jgi:catalase